MGLIRVSAMLLSAAILLIGGAAPAQDEPTLKEILDRGSDTEVAPEAPDTPEGASDVPAHTMPSGPVDDFDRGVPRTSLRAFFDAGDEGDWERAAESLDLRNLPKSMRPIRGPSLARRLKITIDRALWVSFATVSPKPEGHSDDGLPPYRDRIGVIDTPQGKIEILMQRVPRRDGVFIWKISNHTVKDIPLLWRHFGYGPLVDRLEQIMPEGAILGFEYWQWVGIAGVLVLAYFLAWGLTTLVVELVRRSAVSEEMVRFVSGPVRLLVFVVITRVGVEMLAPSLAARAILRAESLLIAAVTWLLVRALGLAFERVRARLEREGSSDAVVVAPVRTATQALVILVATLVWLENVGFNVGAALAGLGIGGIAVALAAQHSLQDVFGAVTLYTGRPVRVGDFCRFGDKLGTVEEIGLRWTRVRTLNDTVVSVSNAEFAKEKLENYGARTKSWYHPRLRLRYQSTPDQVRFVLVEVRRLLYAHPRVLPDAARVRFVGYGAYALEIDVFAYLETKVYSEYLEIAEDLNLRIMDVVKAAGTDFALPSLTTYAEPGAAPDAGLAREAEERVGRWREEGRLFLPRFPSKSVSELRRTLPYPPEGSPDVT